MRDGKLYTTLDSWRVTFIVRKDGSEFKVERSDVRLKTTTTLSPVVALSSHDPFSRHLLVYVHHIDTFTMSAAQKVQQHPAFQQASAKANYYVSQLDKELSKYPVLQNLEQRTQVPKTYAAIGSVVLLGILLLINAAAQPISNLIGWGLPAYLSFKAIESPSPQDDVQWLTYWVVFGSFNLLESFALRVVLYYFPWYFAFKTVFVVWLQLPAFRGAQTTYQAVLKPVLANVSSKAPAIYQQPTTASADGLRDRVQTATTD